MDEIWAFLRDEQNRAVLAMVGGGAATVVSALWVLSKTLFAKGGGGPPTVGAQNGIASGGDTLIEGDVTIQSGSVPKAAWIIGALGIALLAYAFTQTGDDCVVNGVQGDVTGSKITIQGGSGQVDCG